MTFATLNQAMEQIDNFREKLGEAIYDAFQEQDNYPHEIAKSVINTFLMYQTEQEFEVANNMLTAICGWSLETLLSRIKENEATYEEEK